MVFVLFVAPYFTENARQIAAAIAGLPEVRLGLISQEPLDVLPLPLQTRITAHWRVDDAQESTHLAWAAESLARQHGPIHRILAASEQVQVPVAAVREQLGIEGMNAEAAANFRDKARMKSILRTQGLPCARHQRLLNAAEAWAFAEETGYPLVIKPVAGAGAQTTFRVDGPDQLTEVLQATAVGPDHALIVEEFITGQEHSFETLSLAGNPIFHSLTHYDPTPLDVLRTPWIQWCVVLPREVDEPQYDDIRQAAFRALDVLGMQTGLSHMEWFRRADGSIALSEVGARPPGAQFTTLISRAHDVDFLQAWARLMIFETFDPPQRRYAAGAVYLRGHGQGRIKAIHGLDQAEREVGPLVTDVKLPQIGQAPSGSYEGDGYIILRHERTEAVKQALDRLLALVRVELG